MIKYFALVYFSGYFIFLIMLLGYLFFSWLEDNNED